MLYIKSIVLPLYIHLLLDLGDMLGIKRFKASLGSKVVFHRFSRFTNQLL